LGTNLEFLSKIFELQLDKYSSPVITKTNIPHRFAPVQIFGPGRSSKSPPKRFKA
jgi:hypothetical protein